MSHSCQTGDNLLKKGERDEKIRNTLEKVKHKILVMSGKGGVGKSSVAVNIAVALASKGLKVGLMDVDIHGPSIPGLMGLSGIRPESDEDKNILPVKFNDKLSAISMEAFLPNKDDAVIWRGPMKITVIKQFLGDVKWGELDYLVVDSPPGTGDEPLSVAQEMPGIKAVVVTTPQEISLADVRKSINFCKNVSMPVLGIIENMSGYICADCGHEEDLFGKGGGERTAKEMGVPFLGSIPFDPLMVKDGDRGKVFVKENPDRPAAKSINDIVEGVFR